MLVLSRRKNEAIRIGDEITIRVIEVKGSTVRIGIEAPGHVSIVREELLPGIQQDCPGMEVSVEPAPRTARGCCR